MKKIRLLLLLMFFVAAAAAVTDPVDVAAMQALSKAIDGDRTLGWGKDPDPCPWDLVSCTDGRVTAIQIGNKSLHGTLPVELGQLTALTRLELQNNLLSGPLPSSLGNLTALRAILLHNNQFTSIPSGFFAGLSALQSAFLDNNPFEPWPIPPSLKDCGALVNFSANSANVTGGLPDIFATSFPSLNHVGLAFNSLSGPIPAAFAGSSIRSLWLNNQQGPAMSGGIEVVGGMSGLEELWLQSNGFSGPLPDFSNLTHLRDLQLRDNQLTGIVPPSLTSLKSLDRLTLTNNLLQGPVPVFANSPIRELDLDPKSESFCSAKPGDCDPRVNALLSVVKSFDYPKKFAEDWKGNDPCDGWLGVTCDDGGNITVINFQKLGLNGTIPAEFA